jgi:hypothetical protein
MIYSSRASLVGVLLVVSSQRINNSAIIFSRRFSYYVGLAELVGHNIIIWSLWY